MLVTMPSVFQWQALRAALRYYKQGKHPTGDQLRAYKSAASKDGLFLEKLVAWGLLRVVEESKLGPLDSTYRITVAGGHAAEFGEWEGDPKTWKALPPKKPKLAPTKPVPAKVATPIQPATLQRKVVKK